MTFTVVPVRINSLYYLTLGVYTLDDDTDPRVVAACHTAAVFGNRTIRKEWSSWTLTPDGL